MSQTLSRQSRFNKPLRWRRAIADLILAALLSGPIMAPFFAKLGVFPFSLIAQIIYFMGEHVCPQPDMGLMLMPPNIMAVCMRCYGLLLALLLTRLLYEINPGTGFYWLTPYRLWGAAIATLLMLSYPVEMIVQMWGGWDYNNWIVTPFGFVAGLGIGLFIVPVLYRQKQSNRIYS